MLKLIGLETPPPAGLKTVTVAVPAVAMSLAGIFAMRGPPLSVVGRSVPFQRMTEPGAKFVPITAKVKGCAPTGAQFGSRKLIIGTGFVPLEVGGPIVTTADALAVASATLVATTW
jgi:hypothetical protein